MTTSEDENNIGAEKPDLLTQVERYRNRPDKFVRETRPMHRGETYPDSLEAAFEIRDQHLMRLAELGVNIPANEVIGIEVVDGKEVAYEVADQILGDELDLALANKDPRLDMVDLNAHYAGLLGYMKEVHAKGGFFLSDITRNNQQCMLGHTASDLEDKIYLIDLEPLMEEFHADQPNHPNNEYYFRSLSLLEDTVKLAGAMGQDVEHTLEAVREFRASIGESDLK